MEMLKPSKFIIDIENYTKVKYFIKIYLPSNMKEMIYYID